MHIAIVWLRRLFIGLVLALVLGIVGLMIYQRLSDGPTGPLTGGPFTTGQVIEQPVSDWAGLSGDFEFELVAHGTSRTAGGVLHEGQLYLTCDLGFIWSRLPSGSSRNVLQLIWWFKNWHEKAMNDGRIRIRKDGKLYSANLTRVNEPELIEALKVTLENEAAKFFAPRELGPRPPSPPNDIWFFLIDQ